MSETTTSKTSVLIPVAFFLGSIMLIKRSTAMSSNLSRFLGTTISFDLLPGKHLEGKRTVLVTGGNGFLGSYLVNYLIEKGLNVIVFDVTLPQESKRHSNVTYVKGNLLSSADIERAFASQKPHGVDSVIHVASLIPFLGVPDEAIWAVNVKGTQNVIDAAARHGVRSFVYTSSATVVLTPSERVSLNLTEDCPFPKRNMDTYTTTKVAAEKIVVAAGSLKGMATCVLRPAAIFGAGDKLIADKHCQGLDSIIIGEGKVKIDWVPVECVAMAHVLAEEALSKDDDEKSRSLMNGQAYFIGNNEDKEYRWFNGYGTTGTKPTGEPDSSLSHWNHPHPQVLPFWLAQSLAYVNILAYNITGTPILAPSLAPSLLDFTQRSYTFSSAKASKHFGYKPLFTVTEAIRRLVDNQKKQG